MGAKDVVLMLLCALAGCSPSPGPQAGPVAAPAPRVAASDVDEACAYIVRSVQSRAVTLNRELLERLEGLAKSKPEILAPPVSARKAIEIAGRRGEWPVVENKGFWFVLENQGHPAGDGFFRVSVVDVAAGRLVGSIADTTGNAPRAAPVAATVEATALAWLLSKDTPLGDLDAAKQGFRQNRVRSQAALPAELAGVRLIPDDGTSEGLIVSLAAERLTDLKAILRAGVEYRDGKGRLAEDGGSAGEFEFTRTEGHWACTRILKSVVK